MNLNSGTLADGTLQVTGAGSALTTTGTLTLGTKTALLAAAGATIRLAGLSLAETTTGFSATSTGVHADPLSSIEIGAGGQSTPGAITIDPGNTVSSFGSLNANVVDNGLTEANGGALSMGNVTDTASGGFTGNTTLTGVNTALPIAFAGPNGTSFIDTATQPHITGTITGFAQADQIVDGFDFVGEQRHYTPTGANLGTLEIRSGSTLAADLTLAGNYAGDTFLATAGANGVASTIQVLTNPVVVAPVTGGSATIANTGGTFQRVAGAGSASTLTITGLEALLGTLSSNTVTVGSASTTTELDVTSGGAITTQSLTLDNTNLLVTGSGARMNVTGALTTTNTFSAVDALGGAMCRSDR